MARSAWIAAMLAGAVALLGAATVHASDDDEDPPYMIYIDPETGKYTTADPLAAPPEAPAKPLPRPADDAQTPADSEYSWALLAGAVAALLLVLGGVRMRRRRRPIAIPGKRVGTPV